MAHTILFRTQLARRAFRYASYRVEASQPGERWVHAGRFADRAEEADIDTHDGYKYLYSQMLRENVLVFGGGRG